MLAPARKAARLLAAVLLPVCACARPAPPPPAPPPEPSQDFSAERAWGHLRALTEIGPRVTDTEGSQRARDYITSELEKLGLEVQVSPATVELAPGGPSVNLRTVFAEVAGESGDIITLLAPYDSRHFEGFRFVGANDGASGAALLLELARVLVARPLAYSVWLIFLDAEAHGSLADPPIEYEFLGSRALAHGFRQQGVYGNIRLLVYFNRVADADLRIARDLRSERNHRQEFWRAARRLGQQEAFATGRWESPHGSHLSFLSHDFRRVVAIVDTTYGGDESPGLYADTEEDALERCSPESLAIVGSVTVEALHTISARLARIDRFTGRAVERASLPSEVTLEAARPEPEAGEKAAEEAGEKPGPQAVAPERPPEVAADEGAGAQAGEAANSAAGDTAASQEAAGPPGAGAATAEPPAGEPAAEGAPPEAAGAQEGEAAPGTADSEPATAEAGGEPVPENGAP